MVHDNMQYVFLCPTCGAQNIVGQLACQSCGQKFQYNCPYCDCVVDSSLVNCPNCREALNWPVPHKVKAFPGKNDLKKAKRQSSSKTRGQMPGEIETESTQKKKDPWLTGCLIAIIVVVLIGGAIFVYDTLSQPKTSVPASPVSENESSIQPFQIREPMLVLAVDETLKRTYY